MARGQSGFNERQRVRMNIDSLVQELLDQIPEEKFKSTDEIFCDPAFAGGQFLHGVADRLMRYGHSAENILSRLDFMPT